MFQINNEGGNPYLGSGQLDGDGIPPDFFSDIHVRKAFNYCFDWEAFIAEVYQGEAVQNYGPFNAGLIGYDPDAQHYSRITSYNVCYTKLLREELQKLLASLDKGKKKK